MRMDLDLAIDREEWEPTVAGRRLRFLELSNRELTRYANRLEEQYEKAVKIMVDRPELPLDQVAEIVLKHEDEFYLWLINLHTPTSDAVDLEWVRTELTSSMRVRLLANVDVLNNVGTQVGNWRGLREEAIDRRRAGLTLPTSLEPATESTPD